MKQDKQKTKVKLTYDDIKLNGTVKHPSASKDSPNHLGKIVGIDNYASLQGINEPIFTVQFRDVREHFGLKYILKNYIQS